MSNTLAFAEAIEAAEKHGFTHFARALRLELARSLGSSRSLVTPIGAAGTLGRRDGVPPPAAPSIFPDARCSAPGTSRPAFAVAGSYAASSA